MLGKRENAIKHRQCQKHGFEACKKHAPQKYFGIEKRRYHFAAGVYLVTMPLVFPVLVIRVVLPSFVLTVPA